MLLCENCKYPVEGRSHKKKLPKDECPKCRASISFGCQIGVGDKVYLCRCGHRWRKMG